MSAPLILQKDRRLVKFLYTMGLQILLSRPQFTHFLQIVAGIIGGGYRLTIANIHRTTAAKRALCSMTRFLSKSPWDEAMVNQYRKVYVMVNSTISTAMRVSSARQIMRQSSCAGKVAMISKISRSASCVRTQNQPVARSQPTTQCVGILRPAIGISRSGQGLTITRFGHQKRSKGSGVRCIWPTPILNYTGLRTRASFETLEKRQTLIVKVTLAGLLNSPTKQPLMASLYQVYTRTSGWLRKMRFPVSWKCFCKTQVN